jgi:D-glycero-beta-D-manno-heptose-7-phosphate kinase
MPITDFDKLFDKFPGIKIGVVGDVMLDTYWWGHVERISPEAPVPVVSLDKKEYRIGGAGNVALNLASLGAVTQIISVIGTDDDGQTLKKLLEDKEIGTEWLLTSKERITTNKARIISRNQQMMRLDSENTHDLSPADEEKLVQAFQSYVNKEKPSAVIFEDYNKGILTQKVIQECVSYCKRNKVLTAVDPKKKNFFNYREVNIFKPNLKEVREGLNIPVEHINTESLEEVHKELQAKLQHEISFITLSEKGVFFRDRTEGRIIPSHFRNITDVSGAGDTVIAVASLIYACTANVSLMASVANIAGGLVCEEVGTVAVDKHRLLKECKLLL